MQALYCKFYNDKDVKQMGDNLELREDIRLYILKRVQLEELDDEIDLFQAKIVNSLFVIELIIYIEKTFNIRVLSTDLSMNNFRSVRSIHEFIVMKKTT